MVPFKAFGEYMKNSMVVVVVVMVIAFFAMKPSSGRYGSYGDFIDMPCGMAVETIHPRLNDAPGVVLRPFESDETPQNWVYQDLNGNNRYTLVESGCWSEN
jgi:hypothetical protein